MPEKSRRNWFRLQSRQQDTGHSIGQQSPGLQDIPQPVNHNGSDLSELPPMREALLSAEQVHELFMDIDRFAADVLLMQRSPRTQRAAAARATTSQQLTAARDALLTHRIPRIQLRYHWDNSDWIDTLECRDDGVRLVRIAHRRDSQAPSGRTRSAPVSRDT